MNNLLNYIISHDRGVVHIPITAFFAAVLHKAKTRRFCPRVFYVLFRELSEVPFIYCG